MYTFLTLSEYAKFMQNNFNLVKGTDFYYRLALKGDLENAFKSEGGKWLVKVKSSVYQINDMEEVIKENIQLKEKLENVKKIIN